VITSPCYWVNLVLGVLLVEYALLKCKAPRQVVEERDAKYPAFRRYDVRHWKRWRLYLIGGHILFPRLVTTLMAPMVYFVVLKTLTILTGASNPQPQWMKLVLKWLGQLVAKSVSITGAGLLWYTFEEANVDYRPFLGADWKPTKKKPATFVCNHSMWLDILIATFKFDFPRFTAKDGIKKWPLIGLITEAGFGAIFIKRAGSKEEREQLVEEIMREQEKAERGEERPLILYPEGCTTNNTELVTFRRGAFFGLYSVQPITINYHSPWFQPSHDILDVFSQALLLMCQPYTTARVRVLPVFKPNEFFLSHHVLPGEEKWQAYMRVVRQLMGDSLGFRLSEQRLEDKFDYKALLYPGKGSKNKYE